jgi:hypothetical protein
MRNSFWQGFLGLVPLLSVAVAVISWFVGSYFNAARDRANKQREIRLQYQIETYRHLALAAQRKPEPKYFRDMESAAADIQLFGAESQIQKLNAFLGEWSAKNKGSFDDLLVDLRNDLRRELDLPAVPGGVQWFRPEGGVE